MEDNVAEVGIFHCSQCHHKAEKIPFDSIGSNDCPLCGWGMTKTTQKTIEREVKELDRWNYRGRICRIVKHPVGHYCGYVETKIGEELENPHYGYEYGIADVHGGVTYGPENGWIGFDTGHARDMNIDENGVDWGTTSTMSNPNFIWSPEDVKEECERFADNIIEEEHNLWAQERCEQHGSLPMYNDKTEEWLCPFCEEET